MGTAIIENELEVPGKIIYGGNYLIVKQDPLVPIPVFLIITIKKIDAHIFMFRYY